MHRLLLLLRSIVWAFFSLPGFIDLSSKVEISSFSLRLKLGESVGQILNRKCCKNMPGLNRPLCICCIIIVRRMRTLNLAASFVFSDKSMIMSLQGLHSSSHHSHITPQYNTYTYIHFTHHLVMWPAEGHKKVEQSWSSKTTLLK